MNNIFSKGDYLLEFSKGRYVKSTDFFPKAYFINNLSKEDIYYEIQILDKGKVYDKIGPGGKEHIDVLKNIAIKLSLCTDGSKNDVAKIISNYSDYVNKWSKKCYSVGDTITKDGLFNIYVSLWCHINEIIINNSSTVNIIDEPFKIGESISVEAGQEVLDSFQSFEFTHAKALSEFIDNSIASVENDIAIINKASNVNINIAFNQLFDNCQEVVISDDSAGININDIRKVLRAGDYKENKGLNVYGLGMKYAAFWCSKLYIIESHSKITTNIVKSFKCTIGRNVSKNSVIPERMEIDEFMENRSHYKINNFQRESGTHIKLYIMKSDYKSSTSDKFRPISKNLFYNIVSELTEIYHDYLKPGGYINPEGKILKLNLTFTFTNNNSSDKKIKIAANYKDSEYKIVNSPFWKEKGVKTKGPIRKWVFEYNIELLKDDKKINIPCKLYLMEENKREYATIKLLYRGKAIRDYTYIVKDIDRPTKKEIIKGNSKQLGQKGQRGYSNIRGEIDFTNVGKTLDGNNINLTDEELSKFYILLKKEFQNSDLFKMAKYYNTVPDKTSTKNSFNNMKHINNIVKKKKEQIIHDPVSSIRNINDSINDFLKSGLFNYSYEGLLIHISTEQNSLTLTYKNEVAELGLFINYIDNKNIENFLRSLLSFIVTFFKHDKKIISNFPQSLLNFYTEIFFEFERIEYL